MVIPAPQPFLPAGQAPAQAGLAPRRRVLFLIPLLSGGGAERAFSVLLANLDRAQWEPHLAVLRRAGNFADDIPADVAVHELGVSRVRFALPGIIRLARKLRPHTILSTLDNANLALLLTRAFLPPGTRLLVREATMPSVFVLREKRQPRLWAWLIRRLYPRADFVLCLSDAVLEDLAQHFRIPRGKLARINSAVDVERIAQVASAEPSPFSGDGPQLVSVGRLRSEKGLDLLIAAMVEVRRHFPGAQLTLVGEGPAGDGLRSQAKELGLEAAVHFAGFQKNPWKYVRHADAAVFPSRYEGTPNALLEALALGTPVVAAACPGGVREIQKTCGELILVPAENSPALAEAIVAVCRHSSPMEARRPSAAFLAAYSLPRVMAEYSKLIAT